MGSATPETFQKFQALLLALTQIKVRFLAKDPCLTPAEISRISTVLPYNLDAWDGYPVEREKVYAMAKGKKLIALSGDSHNGWYSDLSTSSAEKVGKEFATSSVTSPGFEQYLGTDLASWADFEQALALLVDDLNYLDASKRGYVLVKVTSGQVTGEWRYISTISTLSTTTTTLHSDVATFVWRKK